MKAAQKRVEDFNIARNWDHGNEDLKDYLLNIVDESGEAWNLIKWIDRKAQQELVKKQHDEWEDFVGDQLFLIFKIAWLTGVDSQKAFERSMADFEKRFPVEKVKGKHANIHSGGYDAKYS